MTALPLFSIAAMILAAIAVGYYALKAKLMRYQRDLAELNRAKEFHRAEAALRALAVLDAREARRRSGLKQYRVGK
jgi:hypothetical protein